MLLTALAILTPCASSLAHHRGQILLLANFDGTWPGLVGVFVFSLGTLTSLVKIIHAYGPENFDDTFLLMA